MQSNHKLEQITYAIVRFGFRIIHKELTDQTFQKIWQFVKFCIVGVSNTIISYVLYVLSLLALQGLSVFEKYDYIISSVIAFVLSVLWSFYWNNRYVFTLQNNEKRSVWKALIKTYISYSFTGLFLNMILMYVWVDLLGISKFIAPIINLVISVPVNFVINKFWAFKTTR